MSIARYMCAGSLAVAVLGLASLPASIPGESVELGPTQEPANGQLYSLTVFEEGFDITVTEVERGRNFSLIVTNIRKSPTVTASGAVVGKAQFDIAKERGFKYFFLAPRPRERGAGNVASLEEIHFAEHGSYTHSVESLRFQPSFGISLVITATTDGWAGAAAHAALGGEEGCAIYYGSATAPTSPAQPTKPGQVACTGG